MKQLDNQLEDFASIPVPKHIRYSGLSIALVTSVLVFGAASLSLGAQIGASLGFRDSMIAFVLGGFFLFIVGYLIGIIGVRSRFCFAWLVWSEHGYFQCFAESTF